MSLRILATVAALAASSVLMAADIRPAVTEAAEALIDAGQANAVVIGVFAGQEHATRGFGALSPDDPTVPDGGTRFEIGSITKVMTAQLVELLVRDGKLGWEDTLADSLPDWRFASDEVAAIQLAELAKHTSGLPRLPSNIDLRNTVDPYASYGAAELEAFFAAWRPETLTKTPAYSNLGVGLLGYIAGEADGRGYAAALSARLLAPLKLSLTSPGHSTALDAALAVGSNAGDPVGPWNFTALAGAGAVVSTADDMLRWLQLSAAENTLDGALYEQLGGPAWKGAAWRPQSLPDGRVAYSHGGQTGGYVSFALVDPETREGVVVLTSSSASGTAAKLAIAQLSPSAPAAEGVSMAGLSGAYELAPGFVVHVFTHGDELWSQATNQGAFQLTPDADGLWRFDTAGIQIRFNQAEDGQATSFMLSQGGRETPGRRLEGSGTRDIRPLASAAQADYIGEFRMTPTVTLSVRAVDDHLTVQLSGQPAFPAYAFDDDAFLLKVVDAQIEFERDDAGDVQAAVLVQNGGRQRATRMDTE
ncbi:MAG: serine hydrolase [Pseudomonadota bacterium]